MIMYMYRYTAFGLVFTFSGRADNSDILVYKQNGHALFVAAHGNMVDDNNNNSHN